MNRSLRFRLTAWYLAFFSFLFALFGLFFYSFLASGVRDRLDESLRSQANTLAGLMQDEVAESNGNLPQAALEAVSEMRIREGLIAIYIDGEVAASEGLIGGEPARPPAAIPAPGRFATFPGLGPHGSRGTVRKDLIGSHAILALTVAPLDAIDAELRLVRRILLFALPPLLALAALGGWALATRGLAPLGWMARQAREITGSSLHKRLDIGPADEELATLVASFNELLARLDKTFETMRRFVADASHELRTPISVIRGEADVALSHDRPAAEYRESLAIVLDESRRLTRLVDDLLNLTRADGGHATIQAREFYLNDLLADCGRAAQALAAGRNIGVECRPGDDAPFRGDEELLRRVVMNLLDNAIRYTPPGGKVSAVLEDDGSAFRIRVSDNGPGIAPEDAKRIFERFYRTDEARSRQNGGFGLGLSIVKWIAEAHKGTVEVASRLGEGSVFTVTLPR